MFLSTLTFAAIFFTVLSAFVTSGVKFTVHIQVCGTELPNHHNWICGREFDNINSAKRTSNMWSNWWNNPFRVPHLKMRKHYRQSDSQIKRNTHLHHGIADECCNKSCSLETFASYCHRHIPRTTIAQRGMTKICPSLTTSQELGQEAFTSFPPAYSTMIARRPGTVHTEPRPTHSTFDVNINSFDK